MAIFENIILRTEILNDKINFIESQADYHIAFGIDRNFARGMGVLISAISQHNCEAKVVYHVFTDGIDLDDINKLKQLTQPDHVMIKFYYIDIAAFKNLPTTIAWSYATYYRFIMGKVLYGSVERVLYIDADILCLNAIKELTQIDMESNIVLAIAEPGQFNVKRLNIKQGRYFNAGALYIDINKWNEAKIGEQAVQLLSQNPEKYPYLDQDVLNILLDGKTRFIEEKWNYLYDMRKVETQLPDGVNFVHFIGDKPWQVWSEHHFMVKIYMAYAKKSPWAEVPLVQPRHYKEKKRLARSYRKRHMYFMACCWYFKYAWDKITGAF